MNRIYTSIIHRLNTRCKALFGEEHVVETNFRLPVPPGDELLGLEYLSSQSSGENVLAPKTNLLEDLSANEEVVSDVVSKEDPDQ